jgi:hypothetical protein
VPHSFVFLLVHVHEGSRLGPVARAGYAALTVSASRAADVAGYIAAQQEHHRRVPFQEEFLSFSRKHDIEYDTHDLWG